MDSLRPQLVEIVPEGLDQKTDATQRLPGKLERAVNVEFDKTSALNLRRGYQRQPLGTPIAALSGSPEDVFAKVDTYDDELLLFGVDDLYALGSRSGQLGGSARWVRRGPLSRGNVRLQHVAVSGMTDEHNAVALPQIGVFAGHDQADSASLTANGHTYRCYVYRDATRNRIGAVCFVELEHGQDVVVFRNFVALGTEVAGAGTRLDCPKVIAVGTTFVVHWIAGEISGSTWGAAALWRATMQMTDIDASTAWVSQGSIATHIDGLYDAQPLVGSSTDYIVAHKWTTGTDIQVRRQTGVGWGATLWTQLFAATIANRVLCCSGHLADGDVLASFQVGGQLVTARWAAATGLAPVSNVTFVDAPFVEWGQVGHVRALAGEVLVVAEGWEAEGPSTHHHGVAWRRISGGSASRVGSEQWTLNLALCSRPYIYASARAPYEDNPSAAVLVSFKSVGSAGGTLGTWEQRSYFVIDLGYSQIDSFASGLLRARPIANLGSNGSADARVSGHHPSPGVVPVLFAKRMNHIASPSGAPASGPDVKTRTLAAITFNRVTQRRVSDVAFGESTSELIPTSAGVVGYRVYLEDPWIAYRDDSDPAEPTENFRGTYSRALYQSARVGRCLFVSGGSPQVYDGHAIVDAGFPWHPEITEIASFAGAGGLEPGVRWWTATWEWRDAAGQVHRSRPAKPVRHEVVGTDDNVRVTVRCLNLSVRDAVEHYPAAAPINLVLWRTEVDGQTFYRVHGGDVAPFRVEDTPVNDPRAYQVEIDDTRPDGSGVSIDLARSDQLPYNFTSGVSSSFLPVRPPASHACCVWQGRIWLASSEDPRELWYSAEILPAPGDTYTVAPEWHFENRYVLPELGEVVALQPMEDELVVFTRDGIYKLIGQGNSLGTADATYQLATIHEGTGCVNPRSVVLAPPGVFFQSAKGIYLYGRGRELDYLSAGAAIEDEIRAAGYIRGAVLLEDRHQIRVSGNASPTGAPRTWIYDYYHRQWSRADHTPPLTDARLSAVNSACAWRGAIGEQLHVVLCQGCVLVERATTDALPYADENAGGASVGYGIDVMLSWIHLAGVSGLKRVREIGLQMAKPAAGPVYLDALYDVVGDYVGIAESFAMTSPSPAYLRFRPRVQKMSAIRLRIYEDALATPAAANRIVLRAFVLQVLVKPQSRRVPATQIGS